MTPLRGSGIVANVSRADLVTAELPVFDLDDVSALAAEDLRQVLGGKGAGLVDMRRLGIPVPPAFVLGTGLCRRFLASGWPAGLDDAIDQRLGALETAAARRLGDGTSPLLVSVRSGAPVSMPGMMDTILNLGANDRTIAALAAQTGDERFALNTWSRFTRMYATTVLEVAADVLGGAPAPGASAAELRADVEAVRAICLRVGRPIPDDPRTQLRAAIEAVFRSSCSERARVYREQEGLAQDMPTAVVVQAMVFGNMGLSSGTGVAFSRNPSTGANELYGDFLINAQGEDVVSGACPSEPLAAMSERLPDAFRELSQIMRTLERHYRDLCDVEITVQEGRLHVLQVRVGKRAAIAAARIAVEMASGREPLITRAEAVRRVTHAQLRQLQNIGRVRAGATLVATGVAASPGTVSGVVCLDPDRVADLAATDCSVILVRPTTSPDDVHGIVKAAGILTSTGGMVSHAALVARGWGIAAVCGAQGLSFEPDVSIGGVPLQEGDVLTIDGGNGDVYLGNCVEAGSEEPRELQTLRHWATDLGIELGGEAGSAEAAANDAGGSAARAGSFEIMRALALLGFATAERLAVSAMSNVEAVRRTIDALPEGHVNRTPRGLQVASEGRLWLQARLDAERSGIGPCAEGLYNAFVVCDARFKQLVADWQVRTVDGHSLPNDHSDRAYDAMVQASLCAFHGDIASLVDEICAAAPRLKLYQSRLARAAAAIAAGDGTMIASPLKDSYHTVWFELHEELIHLSGRNRAMVEASSHA